MIADEPLETGIELIRVAAESPKRLPLSQIVSDKICERVAVVFSSRTVYAPLNVSDVARAANKTRNDLLPTNLRKPAMRFW